MSSLSDCTHPILLAGLGSPLMTDEGIGVYLVEEIRRRGLLIAEIEVLDLGTGNMNVLHAIAERRKVVFVDCAKMGESPGTMRRFTLGDVVSKKVQSSWSAHDGDLLNLLNISKMIGELPDEIVLFGIEPETIDHGQQLTECLQSRIEDYIGQITNYLLQDQPR